MPAMEFIKDYAISYGFQVIGALVVLVVGIVVARWVGKLTQQWLERQDLEPPVRMLLVKVIQIVVVAFAGLAALGQLGVQIAPLLAGVGVAGLGVGLALQGVLSNVVAGLSIIFTKPYRVGEHISILGVHGDVQTISIFSTVLLHPDRSRVVIPNRKIVGEILHNFGTIRQLHLQVGVAYSTNLTQALTLVREILTRHPSVLKDPMPVIGVSQLGDSTVTIAIEPWTSISNYGAAQGELNQAVIERFREAHIDMPFPQREVRLLSIPE
ncbi:mechanosensitive ion channel protein [Nitrospira sp. KM1]|uniref:mechanosensitive ion channel family protein n=1 Tax=Nitrospira sp. KM1 TaxID=1936990 RepID=UPI0013A7A542|nr:mechanosensitive ion channel domain-containing protein [Nitrospira sp. KM1]BCA56502.1 mechanosensitive ion channel protein [Nitrospira sp. KM1]